jgi:hypothetical protein
MVEITAETKLEDMAICSEGDEEEDIPDLASNQGKVYFNLNGAGSSYKLLKQILRSEKHWKEWYNRRARVHWTTAASNIIKLL